MPIVIPITGADEIPSEVGVAPTAGTYVKSTPGRLPLNVAISELIMLPWAAGNTLVALHAFLDKIVDDQVVSPSPHMFGPTYLITATTLEFDVLRNAVSILPFGSLLRIPRGDLSASLTGLSIGGTRGDRLSLKLLHPSEAQQDSFVSLVGVFQ